MIDQLDWRTGEIKPWRELSVADGGGLIGIEAMIISASNNTWVYGYSQQTSELYLVEGLR